MLSYHIEGNGVSRNSTLINKAETLQQAQSDVLFKTIPCESLKTPSTIS